MKVPIRYLRIRLVIIVPIGNKGPGIRQRIVRWGVVSRNDSWCRKRLELPTENQDQTDAYSKDVSQYPWHTKARTAIEGEILATCALLSLFDSLPRPCCRWCVGERKGARLRDCLRRRHGQAPLERNKPKTRPRGARRTSAFHLLKPAPKRRLAVSLRLGCLSRSKSMLASRRFRVATDRMRPDSRSRGKRKVPPAARARLRQRREARRGRRVAPGRGGLVGRGCAAPDCR